MLQNSINKLIRYNLRPRRCDTSKSTHASSLFYPQCSSSLADKPGLTWSNLVQNKRKNMNALFKTFHYFIFSEFVFSELGIILLYTHYTNCVIQISIVGNFNSRIYANSFHFSYSSDEKKLSSTSNSTQPLSTSEISVYQRKEPSSYWFRANGNCYVSSTNR